MYLYKHMIEIMRQSRVNLQFISRNTAYDVRMLKVPICPCWKRLWGGLDCRLTSCVQEIRHLSPPLLSLECTFFPCSHSGNHFQGHNLERAMCWGDHLDGIRDWTQSRALYKHLRLWQVGVEIYLFHGPQDKSCKFFCLLHLPTANVEWPASFSVSPCSGVRGLFY